MFWKLIWKYYMRQIFEMIILNGIKMFKSINDAMIYISDDRAGGFRSHAAGA